MEKTVSKYNSFKEMERDVWKSRFIWRGLNGKDPKYTTTINRFFDETKILESVEIVNTANGFFDFSTKMADEYVKWVGTKGTNYKKSEYDDMRNFFSSRNLKDELMVKFQPRRLIVSKQKRNQNEHSY